MSAACCTVVLPPLVRCCCCPCSHNPHQSTPLATFRRPPSYACVAAAATPRTYPSTADARSRARSTFPVEYVATVRDGRAELHETTGALEEVDQYVEAVVDAVNCKGGNASSSHASKSTDGCTPVCIVNGASVTRDARRTGGPVHNPLFTS